MEKNKLDKLESYKMLQYVIVTNLGNKEPMKIGEKELDLDFMFELLEFCRKSIQE